MEPLTQVIQNLPPPGHVSTWVFAVVVSMLTAAITWLGLLYVKSRNHERQTHQDMVAALSAYSKSLISLMQEQNKTIDAHANTILGLTHQVRELRKDSER